MPEADTFSIADLRKDIKINRIRLEQLFEPEDIQETDFFKKALADKDKTWGAQIEQVSAKAKELEGSHSTLVREVTKYKAMPLIKETAVARKLPDEAMIDLELEQGSFNPDPAGDIQKQVEGFVDSVAQKYQKRQEAIAQRKGGTTTPATTPAGLQKPEPTFGGGDMTDPKNNPFIPE